MIDDLKIDAEQRMRKSVESLAVAMNKIRTGRAHPGILDTTTATTCPSTRSPTSASKKRGCWW
jgi:ribosome recycling factor